MSESFWLSEPAEPLAGGSVPTSSSAPPASRTAPAPSLWPSGLRVRVHEARRVVNDRHLAEQVAANPISSP